MAKVDSGLGWLVDEEYYIYDVDTVVDLRGDKKLYDGSAIIALICPTGRDTGYPVCISTDEDACKLNNIAYSNVIDGVTWYATKASNWVHETEKPEWMQKVTSTKDAYWIDRDADREVIIADMLIASGYEIKSPAKDVPSVDYVKHYVEGVVKENNEHLPLTNEQLDALLALI